jgi:hypothetical protein
MHEREEGVFYFSSAKMDPRVCFLGPGSHHDLFLRDKYGINKTRHWTKLVA